MPKRSAALSSVLTALALTGGLTLGADSAEAAPQAAPSIVAAVTDVAKADVDGDKRPDTISVTMLPGSTDRFRLSVKLATGKSVSTTYTTMYNLSRSERPLYGAAAMDGQAGSEIIVRNGSGPHTWWYRVFTMRNGRLMVVNSPESRTPNWCTDSGAVGWRFFIVKGTRMAEHRLIDMYGPSVGGKYAGTLTTFRWKSGGWQRVSAKSLRAAPNSKEAAFAIGWHGLGKHLPAY